LNVVFDELIQELNVEFARLFPNEGVDSPFTTQTNGFAHEITLDLSLFNSEEWEVGYTSPLSDKEQILKELRIRIDEAGKLLRKMFLATRVST